MEEIGKVYELEVKEFGHPQRFWDRETKIGKLEKKLKRKGWVLETVKIEGQQNNYWVFTKTGHKLIGKINFDHIITYRNNKLEEFLSEYGTNYG